MTQLFRPAAATFSIIFSLSLFNPVTPGGKIPVQEENLKASPKIQAAILLDVSNSMDGLIEQAKAQLWNMVSVMGKATCNGVAPQIEIALYEYGRSNNNVSDGYVKQISPFTSDLDKLSQDLFKLTTNGGDEYCGQVIFTSLNELNWDTNSQNYKVIFIAGNEDFLQGSVLYTKACDLANQKGVIVNTIYCGDRLQGIKEHWNLAGECGNGSFTNINQDAKVPDIPTPYDSALTVLNTKLNGTYLYYGTDGKTNYSRQNLMDAGNAGISSQAAAQRTSVKGNKQLYNNASWDLVDAMDNDSLFIAKVDMKTLPDSLQTKSRAELKQIVDTKNAERSAVQKEIAVTSLQREMFIATERARSASGNNNIATLETEVEKVIRGQAKRFNMIIR